MRYNRRKIFISLLITCICLLSINEGAFSWTFNFDLNPKTIETKRKHTREKIFELKRKEKVEIDKLWNSQKKLEVTKSEINHYNGKLNVAKDNLHKLNKNITVLSSEQERAANAASDRLRQVYKGERISMLHLIFASNDINSFLDRVYYQKRLAVHDKVLLNDLRNKTKKLIKSKQAAEYEKNNIVNTIEVMNKKKRDISSQINLSQYLINKLRTDRATFEAAEKELAQQSASLENKIRRSVENVKITTGFLKPIIGSITSGFGWRRHPIFGSKSFHSGVDIAASYGTPVKASNSGKVIFSGWYGGYGKVVIINHGQYQGKAISTLYAHLSRIAVSSGSVKKGQIIGYEGSTGYSTGPHLHFEVRIDGKPTNPMSYIR